MGSLFSREPQEQQEREREAERRRQRMIQWRPYKEQHRSFDEEAVTSLRQDVLKQATDRNGKELTLKFLIFGMTGHGKSSFCNGARSAILNKDFVDDYHQVGVSTRSFTDNFTVARYGEKNSVWFIDMQGVCEGDLFNENAIQKIMRGEVSFTENINAYLARSNSTTNERVNVEKEDIACVIFILKSFAELPPHVKEMFRAVDKVVQRGELSRQVVLTHLDLVDDQFQSPENLPNLAKSDQVLRAVEHASNTTGVPVSNISVVRNYVSDTFTNRYSDLLYLHTVEKLIHSGISSKERVSENTAN